MTAPNIIPLPAPKPARKFAARKFKHLGQNWRLFKRSADPDAPWYFYFERDKQRFGPTSMQTWIATLAEERAKQAVDLFYSKKKDAFESAMGRKPKEIFSTIGDVLDVVLQLSIKAQPKTRNEYVGNLFRVLRRVMSGNAVERVPTDAEIRALPLSVLNDDLAAKFFAGVEAEAATLPDQVSAKRLRVSWLSMFQNAMALFADRPLYQYKKLFGLKLPDLKDWRNGAKIHGPHLPRAGGFQVPDDAILRRTLREWVKLGNTPGYVCRNRLHRGRDAAGKIIFNAGPLTELDRRNLFFAIGLELSCGLRKSETRKVRFDWIKHFAGMPHLSSRDVNVKNATGEIHVVPLDPYWNFMLRTAKKNGWWSEPTETLLQARPKTKGLHHRSLGLEFYHGGHCDVTHWTFMHLGWWMRDLGWTTQKAGHALRDWSASNITMKYGLDAARDWCRHSSRATTEANYNRFRTLAGQVNLKKLAWFKWAR